MQESGKFLADPRQRMLVVLAVLAIVGTALAGLAIYEQHIKAASQSVPKAFLAGFSEKLREAAKIHIESKDGALDIVFKPQKGWVLAQRADYPASMDEVRKTLIGLGGLEIIEPKTARADWLSYLGLGAPPDGDGVIITVYDDKGDTLASIIAGKTSEIADDAGATGLFVRAPSSNESWLVRSQFTPHTKPDDWMDKNVLSLARDRIKSVDVDPESGASFTVRRDAPDHPEFAVTPIPKDRAVSSPTIAYNVVDAASNFTFNDIKPASEFNFSKSSRMVFRTFDGLMVSVMTIKDGEDYWAHIEARPIAGMDEARDEAREISAHTSGWAYKLSSYEGAQFMPTLESLLTPKAEK